jgi:hypothetical protein
MATPTPRRASLLKGAISDPLTWAGQFCPDGPDGRTALTNSYGLRESGSRRDGATAAASGVCPQGRLVSHACSYWSKERSGSADSVQNRSGPRRLVLRRLQQISIQSGRSPTMPEIVPATLAERLKGGSKIRVSSPFPYLYFYSQVEEG